MSALVLIPSLAEWDSLRPPHGVALSRTWLAVRVGSATYALCGVGPAAAAASATFLIREFQPSSVLLVGVGGTYANSGFAPGDLVQAHEDIFADLGATDPAGVPQNLDHLGLPLFATHQGPLGCRFELPILDADLPKARFLTVSTISADASRAQILARHFHAAVENMEGAAVALACHLAQVPCYQVRGITNRAGERDKTHWFMDLALNSISRWIKERYP